MKFYVDTIKATNKKIYFNGVSLFLVLGLLSFGVELLSRGINGLFSYNLFLFSFLFILTGLFYPFVKFWITSSTWYSRIFQANLKQNIVDIMNGRSTIDQNTTDDVQYYGKHLGVNNWAFSEKRTRRTAEQLKTNFSTNYVFLHFGVRLLILFLAATFAPILGLFAISSLTKSKKINCLLKQERTSSK